LRKSSAAADLTPVADLSIDDGETDAAIAHSPLPRMAFAD
jgi:hypothetical protein